VSLTTNKPLKITPAAATAVTVTCGAAFTFGSWTELNASMSATSQLAGFEAVPSAIGAYDIEFGIGAAASEVGFGNVMVDVANTTIGSNLFLLPVPINAIPSGSRLSARVRRGLNAGSVALKPIFYEGLAADHQIAGTSPYNYAPFGVAPVSVTPNAGAWSNSDWCELTSGLADESALLGVTMLGNDPDVEWEIDLGSGAAGFETVLTTLRSDTGAAVTGYTNRYLPRPFPVAASTRIACRLRKSDTSVAVNKVYLLYIGDVALIPEEEPDEVEFENAEQDGSIGLFWYEWTGGDATTRPAAKVPLPDDADYYHGFKEGRVAQWYPIRRALSDRSGQYEGVSFGCLINDKDRALRAQLDADATKYFVNNIFVVRSITDEDRRAKLVPRTVARGVIRNYSAKPGLQFEVTAQDTLSVQFALSNEPTQMPRRMVGVGIGDFVNNPDGDFPNANPSLERLGIPIIYGEVSDAAGVGENRGVVPVLSVGQRTWGATDYHEFLFCGHAVKEVVGWHVDGVQESTTTATGAAGWLVPGFSNWNSAIGSTMYVDYDQGRYCSIFIPVGDTDGDAIADGSAVLTLNVKGIEDVGDGTGDLITDIFDQYYHWLVNWATQTYTTGDWLDPVVFEDDDALEKIDEASFIAAKAQAEDRVTGGYVGALIIGADGVRSAIRDVIAQWNISADCNSGWNRKCQYMVSMVPDTEVALTSDTTVTDTHDIISGSFEIVDEVDAFYSSVNMRYAPNYGGHADFGGWYHSQISNDDDAGTGIGEDKRAPDLLLWFIRDQDVAFDIAARWLSRHADVPRLVRWREPLRGLNDELGDIRLVTHYEGIGASGWTANPVRIVRHDADPESMSVAIEAYDMGRYLTVITDSILGDDGSLVTAEDGSILRAD
jgi:hypothetical protein